MILDPVTWTFKLSGTAWMCESIFIQLYFRKQNRSSISDENLSSELSCAMIKIYNGFWKLSIKIIDYMLRWYFGYTG